MKIPNELNKADDIQPENKGKIHLWANYKSVLTWFKKFLIFLLT